MLWAFAVMKKLDPDFCEPILAVLTPEVVSSDSRCALLFPTLRELQVRIRPGLRGCRSRVSSGCTFRLRPGWNGEVS